MFIPIFWEERLPKYRTWIRISTGLLGFLCGSDGKESAYKSGDQGSIPGWGRSPGGGNGIPAWRIPQTEEPELLWSMRSQRAGHG